MRTKHLLLFTTRFVKPTFYSVSAHVLQSQLVYHFHNFSLVSSSSRLSQYGTLTRTKAHTQKFCSSRTVICPHPNFSNIKARYLKNPVNVSRRKPYSYLAIGADLTNCTGCGPTFRCSLGETLSQYRNIQGGHG
jgi:hypothetical protein